MVKNKLGSEFNIEEQKIPMTLTIVHLICRSISQIELYGSDYFFLNVAAKLQTSKIVSDLHPSLPSRDNRRIVEQPYEAKQSAFFFNRDKTVSKISFYNIGFHGFKQEKWLMGF